MNDGFAFFDIIVFAMLAGYLVFQLRRVLGKRTGHEQQKRSNPFSPRSDEGADNDNSGPVSDPKSLIDSESDSGETKAANEMSGLTQLKTIDPEFDDREFLQGAKAAFEWIVKAFASGDREALRSLLSSTLFEDFDAAISQREEGGETLETTIASIKSTTIDGVEISADTALVTVEFVTDQVKVVRNASGAVLDGDPDRIETVTDIWTFSRDLRSTDPNWQLVGTRDPDQ